VYQAVELPLPLHFFFASQAKAVQPFVATDVGEDRFDSGHAVAVDLLAFVAIDSHFHPVGVALSLLVSFDDETCLP